MYCCIDVLHCRIIEVLFWAQNKPLNLLKLRGLLFLGYKQGINKQHYPSFLRAVAAPVGVRSAIITKSVIIGVRCRVTRGGRWRCPHRGTRCNAVVF